MLKLIIMGPPGAGKGTMGRLISGTYNIPSISTGEALREEIKKGTELGKLAKILMDKGDLVPDDIVVGIVRNTLSEMKYGYLLDGFPRTLSQAEIFDNMLIDSNDSIDAVLYINIDDDVIINRISNRLICPKCSLTYNSETMPPKVAGICDSCGVPLIQRDDDNPEFVRNRLKIYHNLTSPLVEYYNKKGILKSIQGDCSVEEEFAQISGILSKIANSQGIQI